MAWEDRLVKQFDILIGGVSISNNGLRTSDAPDIFEGEEVTVSITNLEDGFSYDNLIFDFADSQISTNETSVVNSFDKSGFYTISVTAIGSCGELTKKNAYIEIKNKPPEAFFELEKDTYSVGEVIKLNGLKSKDTKNDEHLLSFYYEWGDGTNSYGKNVKHSYSNPGVYTITFFVKDDDADIDSCSRTITVEGDPEIYEEYDPVEVEEIVQAPSLSITDASIVANASFEVYRENLADEAIFSMLLLANGEPQHGQFINSSSSVDNLMTVSFGVLCADSQREEAYGSW